MGGHPVQLEVPVAWGDLDAFGHVNNTVFFRWFESARMAYFEKIGVPVERPEGNGAILATTTCDFLAEVTYPTTPPRLSVGRMAAAGPEADPSDLLGLPEAVISTLCETAICSRAQ